MVSAIMCDNSQELDVRGLVRILLWMLSHSQTAHSRLLEGVLDGFFRFMTIDDVQGIGG